MIFNNRSKSTSLFTALDHKININYMCKRYLPHQWGNCETNKSPIPNSMLDHLQIELYTQESGRYKIYL